MIASRPENINNRMDFGHWECDLMMFKKGIKTNLITLRERRSRYLVAIKNQSKEADGTAMALINTLKGIKPHVKSITFDQGSEFKRFGWVRDCMEAEIYFCEAGSPYQKGAVENGISLLRIELPRTFDIDGLRQKKINRLTDSINNRPLKCLGYKTPAESCFENINVIKGTY
jgi:IS30 family transposase